jgi:Competence protein J (ComJ)
MAISINFTVSHSQFAVFVSGLMNPFNDWTNKHVAQGFAWRKGSVSFRSIVEAGRHSIEINVVNRAGTVKTDAVRVIEVPFEVPADGAIEIGSIVETVSLSLPAGAFLLRCEFLGSDETTVERVRLTFAREDLPHFAVVRADAELMLDGELLTTAQPALG